MTSTFSRSRLARLLLIVCGFILLAPAPAYSYGDAGLGRVILQDLEELFGAGIAAVHFDGSTLLEGTPSTFIADSDHFFLSFWYNVPSGDALCNSGSATESIIMGGASGVTSTTALLYVAIGYDSSTGAGSILAIVQDGLGSLSDNAFYLSDAHSVTCDGDWHNLAISINTQAQTGSMALDGSPITINTSTSSGAWEMDWSTKIAEWKIGLGFTGDIAEFYMNIAQSIGTDSTTLSWFRNSSNKAQPLGDYTSTEPACQVPLSTSIDTDAEICMRGIPANFPTQWLASGAAPPRFFVGGVGLKYPKSDPCHGRNAFGCQYSH